jgi:hypothetical protein
MPLPRVPLSQADRHAVDVLARATSSELDLAMFRAPTYQRTAVRELARILESIPRAVPSAADTKGDD